MSGAVIKACTQSSLFMRFSIAGLGKIFLISDSNALRPVIINSARSQSKLLIISFASALKIITPLSKRADINSDKISSFCFRRNALKVSARISVLNSFNLAALDGPAEIAPTLKSSVIRLTERDRNLAMKISAMFFLKPFASLARHGSHTKTVSPMDEPMIGRAPALYATVFKENRIAPLLAVEVIRRPDDKYLKFNRGHAFVC